MNQMTTINTNRQDPFDPYPDPEHLYPDFTTQSLYITMRDGIRLAADVILPTGLPEGERIPAILQQTRYWRSSEFRAPFRWFWPIADERNPYIKAQKSFFTSRGYALVLVDVRGTGASFGVWRYPWEPASIEDGREIVDWIIQQPWCSGAVGGMGISYFGTTAELLLATQHPAVKAVLTMFNHPDAFRDVAFPGGLFNKRFIRAWCAMNTSLDQNKLPADTSKIMRLLVGGVRPVDGSKGRALLRKAVREHAENGQFGKIEQVNYRDEIAPGLGVCADDISVERYHQAIASSPAAIFGWASWMDAGTADAAIRRFLTFPNATRLVIGAWNHGGTMQASPYQTADEPLSPEPTAQWREQIRFFDAYLKGVDNDSQTKKSIHFFTLGAETWQTADQWPPAGTRMERLFFAPEHRLVNEAPVENEGEDRYEVDFSASSGGRLTLNRWWSLGAVQNQSVVYEGLESQQSLRLSYSTSPFQHDTEICGYPTVRLFVSSSTADAAIYVYLEDIDPNGKPIYITEGQLRVIHHPISTTTAYQHQVPYHSFRQADARPLEPGKITEITFGLNPVSALIRTGHSLRLSIAGHDDGTFRRYPEGETPLLSFMRSRDYASSIELPLLHR